MSGKLVFVLVGLAAGAALIVLGIMIYNLVKRKPTPISQVPSPSTQVPGTQTTPPLTQSPGQTMPPPADYGTKLVPVSQNELDAYLKANYPGLQLTPNGPIPDVPVTKPVNQTTNTIPTTPIPSQPIPTSTTPTSSGTSNTGSYSDAEIQTWLKSHNDRRAKFGVAPLVWEPSLVPLAQALANENASANRLMHSNNGRGDGTHGENLYMSYSARGAPRVTPEEVLLGWFDSEWPDYDYATNTCKPSAQCGHSTQVVDKRSSQVGCARSTNQGANSEYVACLYFRAGNVVGQKPF